MTDTTAAQFDDAELEADMDRDLTESDHDAIERGLRTIRAFDAVGNLRSVLSDTMARQHSGYDWNADPDGMTLRQSEAIRKADCVNKALAAQPSAGAQGYVTDEWAERFCEAVNWSPDGQECKVVEGEMRCTTFREIAKGHILAVIATDPHPTATPAQPDTGDVAALREALEKARDQYDMMTRLANGGVVYEVDRETRKRTRRKLSEVIAAEADAGSKHCRSALAALSKPSATGREG